MNSLTATARLILLLLSATTGLARADTTPPVGPTATRVGGEHPGFRDWVRRWSAAHASGVGAWWSADVDSDGRADDVAIVCDPDGATDRPTALLVEDARGRRRVMAAPTYDHVGNACTAGREPRFRVTDDRALVFAPIIKRSHEATELALVDGHAVVTALRDGEFRYCQYDERAELDLRRRVLLTRSAVRWPDDGSDCKPVYRVEEEPVLLVGRADAPVDNEAHVVRGRGGWRGPRDAGLHVAVEAADEGHLRLTLTVSDDRAVGTTALTDEATAAADRVVVWFSHRALTLVRVGEGNAGWTARAGAGIGDEEAAAFAFGAEGDRLWLTVPIDWFDLRRELPGDLASNDAASMLVERGARSGTLAAAFYDVDEGGAAPHVVVATSRLPQRGAPAGILLRLPEDARLPPAEIAGFPSLPTE